MSSKVQSWGQAYKLHGMCSSVRQSLQGCRVPAQQHCMNCPASEKTGEKFRGSCSPSPPCKPILSLGNGGKVLPSSRGDISSSPLLKGVSSSATLAKP